MNNKKVKFLLNWNHFGEHLSSCMTKLMTDSSYSDIIIATADKRMIYSHRFVLGSSSQYFHRIFSHMTKQRGTQLVVALPEIKYEIFKILMNYMYKGETQVPHQLLPSVIKAGQFLEIKGLVNLNKNDSNGNCENSSKYSTEEPQCSVVHSSSSGNDGQQFIIFPPRPYDNAHSWENTHNIPKIALIAEQLKPKSSTVEENGKKNLDKVMKTVKCKNQTQESTKIIILPLKNQSLEKISPLPSSSSSWSDESCPPKKLQKKLSVNTEIFATVKEEKESNKSSVNESGSVENQEEKIEIKMEAPDEIEEVLYNELHCEFCNEVYLNPSEWVRHMTAQHEDKGYIAYKDWDKSVGSNTVITCVICSFVCFSATDWAKHLQTWHTERESAVVNMCNYKKTTMTLKEKSDADKKESKKFTINIFQ